jgi:hypothetical protein
MSVLGEQHDDVQKSFLLMLSYKCIGENLIAHSACISEMHFSFKKNILFISAMK